MTTHIRATDAVVYTALFIRVPFDTYFFNQEIPLSIKISITGREKGQEKGPKGQMLKPMLVMSVIHEEK